MEKQIPDPIEVRRRLVGEMIAVILPAVRRIGEAVRGERSFDDDRQLRACIAAARMASILLGPQAPIPQPRRLPHPDVPDDEALALLECLEGTRTTESYEREFGRGSAKRMNAGCMPQASPGSVSKSEERESARG